MFNCTNTILVVRPMQAFPYHRHQEFHNLLLYRELRDTIMEQEASSSSKCRMTTEKMITILASPLLHLGPARGPVLDMDMAMDLFRDRRGTINSTLLYLLE